MPVMNLLDRLDSLYRPDDGDEATSLYYRLLDLAYRMARDDGVRGDAEILCDMASRHAEALAESDRINQEMVG